MQVGIPAVETLSKSSKTYYTQTQIHTVEGDRNKMELEVRDFFWKQTEKQIILEWGKKLPNYETKTPQS